MAFVTIQDHGVTSPNIVLSDSLLLLEKPSSWQGGQHGPSVASVGSSSESQLWHRMLQDNPQCSSGSSRSTPALNNLRHGGTKTRSTKGERNDGDLAPFGFSTALRTYMKENPNLSLCIPPPTRPLCEVSQYTVVIYATGKNSLRLLFTHIMAFLAYPSVSDIHLILAINEDGLLKDTKYGTRIVNWIEQGVIKVIFADGRGGDALSSLWDTAIDKLVEDKDVHSETILWINGDLPKTWNGTTFKSRMHTWRENPDALSITGLFTTSTSVSGERNGGATTVCRYPLLHGTIMHRNYLCYLNHPVTSHVRRYANQCGWDASTEAIGIYLYSISHGYHVVRDPRDNSTLATDIGPRLENHETTEPILKYFGCQCFTKSIFPTGLRQC